VNVQTATYHHFPKAEVELLSLIGDLAAGALERARLNDHLQRQVQELSALAQVSKTITAPIFLDEMLAIVMEMAAKSCTHAPARSFVGRRPRGISNACVVWSQPGARRVPARPIAEQPRRGGDAAGEPVMARDLRSDPLYRNKEFCAARGLLSFLAVPFKCAIGHRDF